MHFDGPLVFVPTRFYCIYESTLNNKLFSSRNDKINEMYFSNLELNALRFRSIINIIKSINKDSSIIAEDKQWTPYNEWHQYGSMECM